MSVPALVPSFPRYRITGTPAERGLMYGRLARREIREAITGYADVFQHYQNWDWARVRRQAARFRPHIEDFSPASMREITGIAEGAGVETDDVLALNTRSEIMFAAGAEAERMPMECTSFALTAQASADRTVLAGQNWDWILQARETAVLVEVTREDGPDFITLVEAGMLAKIGLNESGVGLCTNTLISSHLEGGPGVPYHILLRSVLDSEDGASAANRIKAASRSNSANYLIVDESGFCQDLETTPKAGAVQAFLPDDDGIITHANHFLADHLTPRDVYLERKRHTLARKELIDRGLRGAEKLTIDRLKTVLGDHTGEPDNVCQHPNASLPRAERTCTVAGVILAPESRTMHVAAGNPCVSEWHEIRLSTTTA
ncbi:C45 family autoproteolytic acyltransferase/hydolase [Nonomuraea antimicrobica]|uniref:C45 family autoproteolytic acyltransferase/hydolase n=1 Tax=Nonomuraea antimicrobica TaxID=561173 RepID=A0ABP7B1W9_9ACTN